MALWKEFKEFALKGNVVDLAIGIVIGTAFGAIVKSLVSDVIMPPLAMLLGGADFTNRFVELRHGTGNTTSYASLADAQKAGAITLNYGLLLNAILTFLLIAFSMFLVIHQLNKAIAKRWAKKDVQAAPGTRDCPECLSTIPVKASRCAHCTAKIGAGA